MSKTTLHKPNTGIRRLVFFTLSMICLSTMIIAQSADVTVSGMIVDKSIVTVKNNKLVFNGLSTNQIESGFTILGITQSASNGNAEIVNEFQIGYWPSANICNKSDQFSYLVSNGTIESIKEVGVEILCETLAILSSMSPDGDGTQDSFVILGLENYPKNRLVIFNDLGLEVYNKKNYKNDWDGTYQGEILPSGVYYYIFEPGDGETLSGYLYMGDQIN